MENLTRITVPTGLPADDALPSSPHFDDEATLLTARPVVPINAGLKWEGVRNYVLTAAILLTAAMVGAVAALSIDRFQNRNRPQVSLTEDPPAVMQPSAETTQVPAEKEAAELPPVTQPAVTPVTETETKIKPVPAPKASTPAVKSSRPAPRNNRIADEMALSESNRLERLDGRRRRRVESGRTTRSRDLNRIREIFEGPGQF
jgi:hypothetical protein